MQIIRNIYHFLIILCLGLLLSACQQQFTQNDTQISTKAPINTAIDINAQMALLAEEFSMISMNNPRVALYYFNIGETPIPNHDAQEFVSAFETILYQQFQQQWQFVARKDAQDIINENEEFNYMPFHLLIEELQADIIIKPQIQLSNDGIVFSANAYTPSGQSLLKTNAYFMPYQFQARTYPLDTAIKLLSEKLRQQINDIDHINPLALHYHNSGGQTDFSRYIIQRIMTHITQRHHGGAYKNTTEDYTLKASLFEWDNERILLEKRKRHYNLKGNYWVNNDYISVNIALDGLEESARAHINIDISTIPTTMNVTPRHIVAHDDNIFAQGKFTLTSNKGKNPNYRIGEEGQLIIVAQQDLHLYCFNIVINDDGRSDIFKIFPNHWHQENFIKKGVPQYIPDNTMDFAFIAEPPIGRQEFIRCYGYGQDINHLLSHHIARHDATVPINIYDSKDLDDYMDNISDEKPLKHIMTINILDE